jgi:phage-related protein
MEIVCIPAVADFIDDLHISLGSRVKRTVGLLEELGSELRFPYSRMVARGLFELRTTGEIHVRLLYFYHEGKAIIVHGLIKKKDSLSRKDIEYAITIRNRMIKDI